MYGYVFLSRLLKDLSLNRPLFEDCIKKLSAHDPKWTRDKILEFVRHQRYNCFVYISSSNQDKMVGAVAFNPEGKENVAKAFLVYVTEEFRRQGIGSAMTASFIIWALNSGFAGAQIGLGNSEGMTAVLRSVNRQKEKLLGGYASKVDISTETGTIVFK